MPIDESVNPWIILSSREIYENNWIQLTEHQVLNPGGGQGIYGVVHFKNLAIGVVAMDSEEQIILVGQFRFPLGKYSWEIPEGGGGLDTEPLQSARRELAEETGLQARNWSLILRMHLSNSVSDEEALIYLARDLSQEPPSPEETELLELKKISLEEAYQAIGEGRITDAITVASILKIRLMKLEGRL